jgi:tRNA(Ile)-lysidine synthase
LAHHHGLIATAHHVDHGIRPASADEAVAARSIAERIGVAFELHRVDVSPGPNLEARARAARRSVLPTGVMTGHTADDQAETVLIRLLRGSGGDGLGAMRPGPDHPILALRRSDTEAVCEQLGIAPVRDASNDDADVWRNRIRAELVPLVNEIAGRDVVPIVARTADLLRDDSDHLNRLAEQIDPADARAVAAAPIVLARRAIRRWLADGGYPPDAASVDRVVALAHGDGTACEINGGRRIERSHQHFRIIVPER